MFKIYIEKYNINEPIILTTKLNNHINKYNTNQKYICAYSYSMLIKHLKEDFNYELNDELLDLSNKPKVLDNSIYFNISHENDIIAIIISDKPCGIDVTRIVKDEIIAKKMLSDSEMNEYSLCSEKLLYLSKKWAIKEAYGKMLGVGINNEILKMTLDNKVEEYIFDNIKYYVSYFTSN